LGYFPGYVLLFIAGVAGAKSRWWFDVPAPSASTWRRVMRWSVWLLPLVFIAGSLIPRLAGPAVGGWNVQAFVYAFWEPLVAWGVLLRLLRWAQQRFTSPSGAYKAIGQSAMTVYLIHAPIVVGLGLALHGLDWPVLLKFVVSAGLSVLICLICAQLLLRSTVWRRWF
jgi:surface polysaccharide O-acyltransferase-like enzyme